MHGSTRLDGNPRTSRHDAVKMLLATHARQEGWDVVVEPKNLAARNKSRPDIIFARSGVRLATDVAVGYEARARSRAEFLESLAKSKIESWANLEQRGFRFVPFVVGQTGCLHRSAEELLAALFPSARRPEVIDAVRAAVAEGNAEVFAAAAGRL